MIVHSKEITCTVMENCTIKAIVPMGEGGLGANDNYQRNYYRNFKYQGPFNSSSLFLLRKVQTPEALHCLLKQYQVSIEVTACQSQLPPTVQVAAVFLRVNGASEVTGKHFSPRLFKYKTAFLLYVNFHCNL